MKNLLYLSILFLLIPGSSFGKPDGKEIVPAKPVETTKSEVDKTKVSALIGPILINIATLAKYTFKIAANFEEIKRSAERLKPDVECLTDRDSESCKEVSCATLSKCAGTTLSDLLRVTYPFLEAILGSVEPDGIRQGSLFAIVDTAEKIPGAIPASLYTKLNAEKYKPKVDAVVSKLSEFRDKLPAFTKNFTEAMAMLNGIVLSLNPEMFIDTMPVKPLPPVKELESGEGLSKSIVKDIDTVLALPAPEPVPAIEGPSSK